MNSKNQILDNTRKTVGRTTELSYPIPTVLYPAVLPTKSCHITCDKTKPGQLQDSDDSDTLISSQLTIGSRTLSAHSIPSLLSCYSLISPSKVEDSSTNKTVMENNYFLLTNAANKQTAQIYCSCSSDTIAKTDVAKDDSFNISKRTRETQASLHFLTNGTTESDRNREIKNIVHIEVNHLSSTASAAVPTDLCLAESKQLTSALDISDQSNDGEPSIFNQPDSSDSGKWCWYTPPPHLVLDSAEQHGLDPVDCVSNSSNESIKNLKQFETDSDSKHQLFSSSLLTLSVLTEDKLNHKYATNSLNLINNEQSNLHGNITLHSVAAKDHKLSSPILSVQNMDNACIKSKQKQPKMLHPPEYQNPMKKYKTEDQSNYFNHCQPSKRILIPDIKQTNHLKMSWSEYKELKSSSFKCNSLPNTQYSLNTPPLKTKGATIEMARIQSNYSNHYYKEASYYEKSQNFQDRTSQRNDLKEHFYAPPVLFSLDESRHNENNKKLLKPPVPSVPNYHQLSQKDGYASNGSINSKLLALHFVNHHDTTPRHKNHNEKLPRRYHKRTICSPTKMPDNFVYNKHNFRRHSDYTGNMDLNSSISSPNSHPLFVNTYLSQENRDTHKKEAFDFNSLHTKSSSYGDDIYCDSGSSYPDSTIRSVRTSASLSTINGNDDYFFSPIGSPRKSKHYADQPGVAAWRLRQDLLNANSEAHHRLDVDKPQNIYLPDSIGNLERMYDSLHLDSDDILEGAAQRDTLDSLETMFKQRCSGISKHPRHTLAITDLEMIANSQIGAHYRPRSVYSLPPNVRKPMEPSLQIVSPGEDSLKSSTHHQNSTDSGVLSAASGAQLQWEPVNQSDDNSNDTKHWSCASGQGLNDMYTRCSVASSRLSRSPNKRTNTAHHLTYVTGGVLSSRTIRKRSSSYDLTDNRSNSSDIYQHVNTADDMACRQLLRDEESTGRPIVAAPPNFIGPPRNYNNFKEDKHNWWPYVRPKVLQEIKRKKAVQEQASDNK